MDAFCEQCGQALRATDAACPGCGAATVHGEDDLSKTIMRPARSSIPTFRLSLADGRIVDLDGTMLLGRNPRQQEGTRSITVPDDDFSVSKTHLAVYEESGAVWLNDLQSTNGVHLTLPDGSSLWAVPGARTRVWPGTRVHFGSQSFLLQGGVAANAASNDGATANESLRSPRGPTARPASVDVSADALAAGRPGPGLISSVPLAGAAASSPAQRLDPPAGSMGAPAGQVPPLPEAASASAETTPPAEAILDGPLRCTNCQAEVLANDAFCMECGSALMGQSQSLEEQHPRDAPLNVVIGDISVTAGRVVTPVGSGPLSGSLWSLDEQIVDRTYIAQSTIIWAIVLSVFCGLGLLLLLKKEHEITGTAVVGVAAGEVQHRTIVHITNAADLAATREQVAAAQRAASI